MKTLSGTEVARNFRRVLGGLYRKLDDETADALLQELGKARRGTRGNLN